MTTSFPKYASNEGVIDAARAALGDRLAAASEAVGEVRLDVRREALVEALRILRDDLHYQQLMEIAGVDYPDRPERFEIVYCLLSLTRNHRVRVHVQTNEATPVPSVTALWPVAGWLEREVYDLFGVLFAGNQDLRRILTDYGFRGHPLRKDFPSTGFVEMRYSEEEKRVAYGPVKLAQDFRNFEFLSPWEGAQYTLPGDEKAKVPEAPGAQTPLKADEVKKCPIRQRSRPIPAAPPPTSPATPTRASRRRATSTSRTTRSTSARSIPPRTACCGWCWSWTARPSSGSIRMSACCIAAPRS